MPNGNISSNLHDVLNVWKTETEGLLNPSVNPNFDNVFFSNVSQTLPMLENEMPNSEYEYDREISIDEVRNVINKCKSNKAVGYDNIPYDVMKNIASLRVLHHLFNKIFSTCVIPSLWKLAIIKPISKPGMADLRLPLKYRGISLLSTVSKLYSSIINNRLVEYFDQNNIIVDEQNGFRSKRSCIDHIYGLTSIIRNRKNQGKSTYVALY